MYLKWFDNIFDRFNAKLYYINTVVCPTLLLHYFLTNVDDNTHIGQLRKFENNVKKKIQDLYLDS